MRRVLPIALPALIAALAALAEPSASAAPTDKKPPATTPQPGSSLVTTPSAAPTTSVKAADERSITAGPTKRPMGRAGAANGPKRPDLRGPRLPEEVRARLRAKLDARVDRDLVAIRSLRKEAIVLLTTFVAETPKDAREMPEALMRLGELTWETEREAVVERFREWEKKPQATRGPAPDPNYAPARALFARVLREYPWFSQYDLALYVDGFLATEQGKLEEAHSVYAEHLGNNKEASSVLFNDAALLGNRLKRKEEAAELMKRYLQRGGKETAKAHEFIQNWR